MQIAKSPRPLSPPDPSRGCAGDANLERWEDYQLNRLRLLICSFLVLSTYSHAQSNGEQLFVDFPEYWGMSQVIHQTNLGFGVTVKGRIPASQSKVAYEESIWENRFPNPTRRMPITQFAEEMLKQYWMQCETLRTTKPLVKKERDYEVLYVQATCNRVKAQPYKAIFVRAKYLMSENNSYAVAHEFAFQSFDAVRGGEATVLTEAVFGYKEKADRFGRFMEASTKLLEERTYLCVNGETSCK